MISRRRQYTPIGLDIADNVVHAVQFRHNAGSWKLHACASFEFDPKQDADSNGPSLQSALHLIAASQEFVGRTVVTDIPRAHMEVRRVHLPAEVPLDDRAAVLPALRREARSCLLYNPDEAVLDFVPLADVKHDDDKTQPVLLVACRKEIIHAQLAVLKEAGLGVSHVDISPAAAARIHGHGDHISVQIDFQHNTTVIALVQGRSLLFSRTIRMGAGALVDGLSRSLAASAEESWMLIGTYGIGDQEYTGIELAQVVEVGLIPPETVPGMLRDCLRRPLHKLAAEVKRTVDYFILQRRGGRVETGRVFGSRLPAGFESFLMQFIDVPIEIGDPFSASEGERVAQTTEPYAYVVAAGLALRGTHL